MVQKCVEGNVFPSVEDNRSYINRILPMQESFDLIERNIIIGEKQSVFYFVDGFTKDETMLKIMTDFFSLKKDDMPSNAEGFLRMALPYVEVELLTDFDSVIRNILSGVTCLFIDGYEECIAID